MVGSTTWHLVERSVLALIWTNPQSLARHSNKLSWNVCWDHTTSGNSFVGGILHRQVALNLTEKTEILFKLNTSVLIPSFPSNPKSCAARTERDWTLNRSIPMAPELLNPVAPNCSSLHFTFTHTLTTHPWDWRGYLSKPSAGSLQRKKKWFRKCKVWFKSARWSWNPIRLHLG